jgi:hypothetical protein
MEVETIIQNFVKGMLKKKDKVSMLGRKEYLVKVINAHDGAKLFHHKAKLTSIKAKDMVSVILEIASSLKEREIQLYLPIVDNTRKAHMPKTILTYVVGKTYPLTNLPKQRELHS